MGVRLGLATAALIWASVVAATIDVVGRASAPAAVDEQSGPSPELTDVDMAAGGVVYALRCASCHGASGTGGSTPDARPPSPLDLTRAELRQRRDADLAAAIADGHEPASAAPSALSDDERRQLVAWVRSLGGVRLRVRATDGGAGFAWDLRPGFPPPKVPADNPMTPAKVALGRLLFYDTRLSGDRTFSCGTCHEQRLAFTDGKARAIGHTNQMHPRGAMSLANVAYSPVLTWADPTKRRLEAQALVPMFGEHPVELGLAGREAELLERLRAEPRYPPQFAAVFPADTAPISVANVTRAIAAFERTLLSGRAPYDRYRSSADPRAIAPAAARGEDLFFDDRIGCFRCHGGFTFSETVDFVGRGAPAIAFHNTGLYNLDSRGRYPAPNTGIHAVTGRPGDMGRFRAPSLRNIAVTAPYMHDGSIRTLADVIRHYEAGGRTVAAGPPSAASAAATSTRARSWADSRSATPIATTSWRSWRASPTRRSSPIRGSRIRGRSADASPVAVRPAGRVDEPGPPRILAGAA